MSIERFIDQQEAAAILGVSDRRVRQIIHEEDPLPVEDGRIPCAAFGAWLKRRHLKGVQVGDDGEVYVYEAERARLTKNQADKAALEVAELQGRLLDAGVMAQYWGEIITNVRTKFLAVPVKAAPEVFGLESKNEIQEAMERLVAEVLDELSSDAFPESILRRMERAAERSEAPEAPSEADDK